MKRALALALVVALVGLGIPAPAFASVVQVAGAVKYMSGMPAPNMAVRIRNAATGQVAGTGSTSAAGEFSFANVGPGTYVVEVIDGSGRILATSTSIGLATAATTVTGVAIALTESDQGTTSSGGGGNFFKSTAGILLLAGAAALVVGGIVVATNDDTPKSPSK